MREGIKLPEGWVNDVIGNYVELSQGLAINKKTDYVLTEDINIGLPLLKINNLINNTVDLYANPKLVPKQCIINSEDVIYTRTGQVGEVFINKFGILHNNSFKVIPNEKLDWRFLYWFLKNPVVYNYAQKVASGSVQLDLNHGAFKTIPIFVPPLSEQKSIAAILTAFDDKIELLKAQNKTLEELAQTIFKEWFGKYQMGDELPDGWRVGKLEEVIEFINGYAFKSNDLLNEPEIETLKVFKMGDIKKGGGFNPSKTKSYFRKKDAKKLSKYILRNGDLLMCMTDMKDAISLLGHTALMIYDDEYIVNQRVGLIRAKNDINISYPYLYLLTNEANFISDLRGRSNSGVQVNLSTEAIKQSNIVIADKDTNLKFNIIVKPLFDKVKTNTEQIQTLIQTCDTLLPKLMSGEVRVNEYKS